MKVKILDSKSKEKGSKDLPSQFNEEVRPDIIKRAVIALQLSNRQKYGAKEEAGKRHSAYLSKRRRNYRGTYGIGQSRTPRKILTRRGTRMYYVGAVAPQTVGGRRAHPPKSEKKVDKDINKKERRKAIRSAMKATLVSELVEQKHNIPENYPFLVEKKFEDLKKTKDVKEALTGLGLKEELERSSGKKVRSGKGKYRGRKYKRKKGILIVVSEDCNLSKAARNIPGVDVVEVNKLNADILAPGAVPGRLTLWTEAAIDRLEKEKMFLN